MGSGRRRPLWLVGLLTFLTFGIYFYIWGGLTWAEIKRERSDASMRPFWHALSFVAPIYGYYQIFAHYEAINELLKAVGSAVKVKTLLVVGVYFLLSLVNFASFAVPAPQRSVMGLITSFVLACTIAYGQRGLNVYWSSAPERTGPGRLGLAEWLTLIGGTLFMALFLVGMAMQFRR